MCGANGTENSREASRAPGQRAAAPAPTVAFCSPYTEPETHPWSAVEHVRGYKV